MGCGHSSIKEREIFYQDNISKSEPKDDRVKNYINYEKQQLNFENDKKREKEKKEEKAKKELHKKEKEEKQEKEEKERELKKKRTYKIKSYKNITISPNILDNFPDDISKEEIHQMVYNILDNAIVKDKLQYIKGKKLTEEQVKCLIELLYMNSKRIDVKDNYDDLFKDTNIKIGFHDMNKQNIKKIIFKDYNPTEEEIEEVINQYDLENDEIKLLVIELVN